jgi:hypothetical protein
MQEATSKTLEAISNTFEQIGEQYKNALEAVFDMGAGLKAMDREWEHIKYNSSKYLDTVNKSYQIS